MWNFSERHRVFSGFCFWSHVWIIFEDDIHYYTGNYETFSSWNHISCLMLYFKLLPLQKFFFAWNAHKRGFCFLHSSKKTVCSSTGCVKYRLIHSNWMTPNGLWITSCMKQSLIFIRTSCELDKNWAGFSREFHLKTQERRKFPTIHWNFSRIRWAHKTKLDQIVKLLVEEER